MKKKNLKELSDAELHRLKIDLGQYVTTASRSVASAKGRLQAITTEIHKRRDRSAERGQHVSDHAVVRYLQRVKGIDIAAIEQEILANIEDGEHLDDARRLTVNGGITYVTGLGGTVATVLTEDMIAQDT